MLNQIAIASSNYKMNPKTARYFSIFDHTVQIIGYHSGYVHLLSPAIGNQRAYNASFKCTSNPLDLQPTMENLYNIAVNGVDPKHPRKRLNNSWRNWYSSINTFNSYRRLNKEVRAFGGFIVDCDCRSKQRNTIRTTPASLWLNRKAVLATAELPEPTAIISSGHGFYFVWLFDNCLPNNSPKMMNYWCNIEKKITRDFNKATDEIFGEQLGDTNATDPAHVYRVPETYNNKQGMNPVQCLVQTVSGKTYSKKFWDKHYPFHKHIDYQKKHKHHRIKLKLSTPRKHSMATLAWNTVRDLNTYARLNNYDIKGHREILLFYFVYWSFKATHNVKGVVKHLKSLANKLTEKLPDSDIRHLEAELKSKSITTKHGKQHNILAYRFTKRSMIKNLGITPEQQQYMLILKPSTKNKRRAEAKKRHSKRWNLRDDKVIALKNKGLSVRKIARKMKISRSTVGRIVKGTV